MDKKKNILKVIVVDDQKTFRDGLIFYLTTELGFEVIDQASNGREVINMKSIRDADLIFIDIEMPEINGIEAAKRILWHYPKLPIIAITLYKDKVYLRQLIEAGIKGCIYKNDLFGELEKAVQTVLSDEFYFPKAINIG